MTHEKRYCDFTDEEKYGTLDSLIDARTLKLLIDDDVPMEVWNNMPEWLHKLARGHAHALKQLYLLHVERERLQMLAAVVQEEEAYATTRLNREWVDDNRDSRDEVTVAADLFTAMIAVHEAVISMPGPDVHAKLLLGTVLSPHSSDSADVPGSKT